MVTLFARVWPAWKFSVDVPVTGAPPGTSRIEPAAVEPVTVRFPAIDFAVAGTPQRPWITNERAWPAESAGPPYVPFGFRVSKTRQGVRVWNSDAGGGA